MRYMIIEVMREPFSRDSSSGLRNQLSANSKKTQHMGVLGVQTLSSIVFDFVSSGTVFVVLAEWYPRSQGEETKLSQTVCEQIKRLIGFSTIIFLLIYDPNSRFCKL